MRTSPQGRKPRPRRSSLATVEMLEGRALLTAVLPSPGGQAPTEVVAKLTPLHTTVKVVHPVVKPTHPKVEHPAAKVKAKAKPVHHTPAPRVIHPKPVHVPKPVVAKHRPAS